MNLQDKIEEIYKAKKVLEEIERINNSKLETDLLPHYELLIYNELTMEFVLRGLSELKDKIENELRHHIRMDEAPQPPEDRVIKEGVDPPKPPKFKLWK